MKTSLLSLLAILHIGSTLASADTVLVQDTILNGVKSRTTMSIRGDMMRTDSGTETSVIINTATGDMTTLVHEQKMVMTMNTKTLAGEAAKLPAGTPALPKTTVTSTGRKEKVDGYDCEIFEIENSGTKITAWVASNYPGYDKLKEELKVMQKISSAGAAAAPELPGMMIQSEYEQGGLKFKTQLVSLKSEPVSETVFAIPAGYKAPGAE